MTLTPPFSSLSLKKLPDKHLSKQRLQMGLLISSTARKQDVTEQMNPEKRHASCSACLALTRS